MDHKHRQAIATLLMQHGTTRKDDTWKADEMHRAEEDFEKNFRARRSSVIVPALEEAQRELTGHKGLTVHVGTSDGRIDEHGQESPDKAGLVIAIREHNNPQIEFWGYRRQQRVAVYFQIISAREGRGNVRHEHRLDEITPGRIHDLVVEFLNEAIPPLRSMP